MLFKILLVRARETVCFRIVVKMFLCPCLARLHCRVRSLAGTIHLIAGLQAAGRYAGGAECAVQGLCACSRVMGETFHCHGSCYGFSSRLAPYSHPGFESETYHAET